MKIFRDAPIEEVYHCKECGRNFHNKSELFEHDCDYGMNRDD